MARDFADKEPRRLYFIEKLIPRALYAASDLPSWNEAGQRATCRTCFHGSLSILRRVDVAVCEPYRFAAAHAGRGE